VKFFLDTANLDEIREAVGIGLLDGVTTNPTLIAKEGAEFKKRIIDICEAVRGPVSAEVTATDTEGMCAQGRELAKLHPWVVVKVPTTKAGLKAAKCLVSDGIKVNCTLVFSASQALLVAKT
jgi:transaldolase